MFLWWIGKAKTMGIFNDFQIGPLAGGRIKSLGNGKLARAS